MFTHAPGGAGEPHALRLTSMSSAEPPDEVGVGALDRDRQVVLMAMLYSTSN